MPTPRKFTAEQIAEIRAWWNVVQQTPSAAQMAVRLGVDETAIRDICRYRSYREIRPVECLEFSWKV